MALTYTTDFKGQALGVSATITSNSFTANTGDFITIVACYGSNPNSTAWTVSNTGTAITWTKQIETNTGSNCKVVMWSGTVGATPPTTVSVQSTAGTDTFGSKALFTAIHTGAHTVTPLPAGNLFSGTGGTDVTQAITPTSTGSALWMLVGDWSQTNSFAAAASCTLAATVYNEGSEQTVVPIQPTINPRTDAASFTIGESDTSGLIAWAAWEVQSDPSISNYNPRRLNTRGLNKQDFRSNVLRRGAIAWRESVYRDLNPQATNPAGPAAVLEGNAADVATATGALTTGIKLAGTPADVATATGALTTGIKLAGTPADVATATGALTTGIKLAGTPADVATATGALTTGIPLAGTPADVATATGALTTGIKLAGTPADVATATGALTTGIPLLGNAACVVTVIVLETVELTGLAQAVVTVAGDLTTQIPLGGAVSCVVTATGVVHLLWEPIDTVQTPAWVAITNTQTPAWSDIIDTVQTPAWVAITNTQTPAWSDIIDTQNPNWVNL